MNIGKINYKTLSGILVFIVNGITTYFFAFLNLWSGHTKLIYWIWFVFVLISNTVFTIYPNMPHKLFNFIAKIILHVVVTFLLMLIFQMIFMDI